MDLPTFIANFPEGILQESPIPYEESALFTRIAEGDTVAFETVFHLYTEKLSPAVLRMVRSGTEAEEIIQEVFLRLWLRRAELPAISNPGGWLFTVAANLSLMHLRRQAREFRRLQVVAKTQPGQDDGFADDLDTKWIQAAVEEAVSQLPASRREVFLLSRTAGLSRREIADKLGISEHTVKNQLTAALKFIQTHLDKQTGMHIPAYLFFISVLKNL